MAIYESGEMYLETILVLKKEMNEVRSIDIVRKMNFSKPSVSNGMRHLKEDGYITIDENGFISLTVTGQEIAEKIYERHMILTEILENLGVASDIAMDDACKIEHVISEESFLAIKKHIQNI